jgi:hypothetical protein
MSKLYRPSHRRLSAKLVPTFADRVCRVVSTMDPYDRNLVPDPLLLKNSGSTGNQTRTSRSVVRNFDQQTTEAVAELLAALIRKEFMYILP